MNLNSGEEIAHLESADEEKNGGQNIGHGLFRWRVKRIGSGSQHITNGKEENGIVVAALKATNATRTTLSGNEQSSTSHARVPSSGPLILGDVASVLRSKNSGPYEITFDVMFDTDELFSAVERSGVLNQELIQNLYHLKPEEVIWCGWYKPGRAFKATIPRRRKGQAKASGGFLETDVHGSQQYVPLFRTAFPEDVSEVLRKLLQT